MNFFEYLEQIRQKPERERRRIAIVAVSIITGIIVIVWVNTISLKNPEQKKENAPGPLQVLGATFGAGLDSVRESAKSQIENMKNQFASSTPETYFAEQQEARATTTQQ